MDASIMQGAAGLRVLELSRSIAGAYAGLLLASQGADVALIPHAERKLDSLETAFFDRGKRVLAASEEGASLRTAADVVICDWRLSEIEDAALPVTAEHSPAGKVTVLVTPFGTTGPNAHYEMEDLNIWGGGGLAYVTRKDESSGSLDDERPRLAPGRQPEMLGGIAAATAAVLGSLHAEATGEAVVADVSLQEVQTAMQHQHLPPYVWNATVIGQPASRQRIGVLVPGSDGQWYIRPYHSIPMIQPDYPDALSEEWTQTPEGIAANVDLVRALLGEWGSKHPRDWIVRHAQDLRIPASVSRDIAEVLEWDHLEARGFWDEVVAEGQPLRVPTPPVVGRKGLPAPTAATTATILEEWTK